MGEIGNIWVTLGAKVDDLKRGLGQATKSVEETRNIATRAESAFGGLWKQFAVGNLVATATTRILNGLKSAVSDSVAAAIEAERVNSALESAIAIVGTSTEAGVVAIKKYADAMAQRTVYDDEAIKSAQALIIQMRGTTSRIDEATRGAIGLASVFKMDLQSAARAVAQGFEGNYRSLQMLIPALKGAKDEGEKYNIMMQALAGYYQRAEADADTFWGRLQQLKKAYNELQETIGGFIANNKEVLETLSGVKEIIIWLDRNIDKLGKAGKFRLIDLTAIGGLQKAFNALGREAKTANDEWERSWEGHTAAMLAFRKEALDPLPTVIKQVLPYVDSLVDRFTRLDDDLRMFRMLGGFNIDVRPMEDSFGRLGDVIGGALGDVVNFEEKAADGLFEFLGKGASETESKTSEMTNHFAGFYNDVANGFTNLFMNFKLTTEGFRDFFVGVWQEIKRAFFKVISEMIAKWLVFKALTGIASLVGGPIGVAMKAAAAPLKFWASGFEGVVTRPTLAVVGESGPEYVSVTPAGQGAGGGGVTLNLYAPMISTTGITRRDAEEAADNLLAAVAKAARKRGYAIG